MPWSFGQLKYRLPFRTPSWFPTTNNHFQIKKTLKLLMPVVKQAKILHDTVVIPINNLMRGWLL